MWFYAKAPVFFLEKHLQPGHPIGWNPDRVFSHDVKPQTLTTTQDYFDKCPLNVICCVGLLPEALNEVFFTMSVLWKLAVVLGTVDNKLINETNCNLVDVWRGYNPTTSTYT